MSKVRLKLQAPFSREVKAGLQVQDGLDSFTIEKPAKIRRCWFARLLRLPWRRRGTTDAIYDERLRKR